MGCLFECVYFCSRWSICCFAFASSSPASFQSACSMLLRRYSAGSLATYLVCLSLRSSPCAMHRTFCSSGAWGESPRPVTRLPALRGRQWASTPRPREHISQGLSSQDRETYSHFEVCVSMTMDRATARLRRDWTWSLGAGRFGRYKGTLKYPCRFAIENQALFSPCSSL